MKQPSRPNRIRLNCLRNLMGCRRALIVAACLVAGGSTLLKAEDAAPDKLHGLVNFEFSDKYLTPRGMIVQNEGLVFQPLFLGFADLYKSDAWSATAVGGFWNCFGTSTLPDNNGDPTSWFEIDPIAGLSFGLGKHFTLDVTYTAFNMQIFNIPFSQHLETKLSFNDTDYLKAFALHPYVIFWKELDNKAVASTDGADAKESWYIDVGVAPSWTCSKTGIKIEAPCRVLLPDEDFYGTALENSAVGLYELGLKGTIPIKYVPKGYGDWSFHAGVKYMDFVEKNLTATQGKSETWQIYCGVSSFFF